MTIQRVSRRALLALAAGAAGTGALGVQGTWAQKPIRWRGVANTRNSKQWTEKWVMLENELPRLTNNRLSLEVSSFPELGMTGSELIRVLNVNLVDIAEVVTGYVSGDAPLFEGVQLPGVYKDYDAARRGYEAWLPTVVAPKERVVGGKAIATFAFSSQYLWSKFPVNALDDLKSKKVRVFAKAQADFFQALGAEPVSIPLAEVYTALERGTVDAVVTGPESGAGLKLNEVVTYVTDLQLGVGAGFVVVSRRSWDALPADIKTIIEGLVPELNRLGWVLGAEDTKLGLDTVVQRGMKLTGEAKPEWRPTLQKIAREVVVPSWAKRAGPDGQKAFNETLAPVVGFSI
jgi:TRAP-type transport system periplasmic protein